MRAPDEGRASFPLAPMSPAMLVATLVLFALPIAFVAMAVLWHPVFWFPGSLAGAIYAWTWLRFRPTRFVVGPEAVEVVWPLKRRRLPRAGIASVRVVDARGLRREVGWGVRVGAGGLFGGFGWLWTARRGIVQMYVSRTDGFVWIERGRDRPWLVTPEEPEAFVRALTTT
jgi:Bacterial PH domain